MTDPEGRGPKALCSLDPRPDASSPFTAGLLEDERLASAQQAEVFTKQIQQLQGKSCTQTGGPAKYFCLEGLAEARRPIGPKSVRSPHFLLLCLPCSYLSSLLFIY